MTKMTIVSRNAPQPAGPYSHAVISNGFVYTAGFGPQNPETGKIVGDDVYTQTRQVLKTIRHVLQEAGSSLDSVVKITAYLQDLNHDFPEFNRAYAEFFPNDFPVRTTMGVQLSGILVEIDAIASLNGN